MQKSKVSADGNFFHFSMKSWHHEVRIYVLVSLHNGDL